MAELKYKRVLLKLSGEALAGETKHGVNAKTIGKICDRVKELVDLGAEVAIVVGGGNFWRGKNGHDLERTTSDYMGMLATCMNGLALQDTLEAKGVPARLQTSIEMTVVAEQYTKRNAEKHLSNKRVVIFSGGTGSPFFTTDTAAALRASEIDAEAMLMAKNGVDGVYSDDPRTNPNAKKLEVLHYTDIIKNDLKVMDTSACSLCEQNNIPIIVFDFKAKGSLEKIISGEKIGSYVSK